MSDVDEIVDAVDSLETKIERMEKTYIQVTNDLVAAIKLHGEMLQELGQMVSLAKSPNQKDLERYAALREAFDRYEFVRNLTLGKEDD